jgi:hypothetical protein
MGSLNSTYNAEHQKTLFAPNEYEAKKMPAYYALIYTSKILFTRDTDGLSYSLTYKSKHVSRALDKTYRNNSKKVMNRRSKDSHGNLYKSLKSGIKSNRGANELKL